LGNKIGDSAGDYIIQITSSRSLLIGILVADQKEAMAEEGGKRVPDKSNVYPMNMIEVMMEDLTEADRKELEE
jgi:hypothetical protein